MTAQQRFDEYYITSAEICEQLGVTRASLTLARRRGMFPDPIKIQGSLMSLWERQEVVPCIAIWKAQLDARRGVVNVECR